MIIKDQPHVFVARAPIGLLKERGRNNKGQTHEFTVFLLCNQRVDSEEKANEWLALLNSTVELRQQRDELVDTVGAALHLFETPGDFTDAEAVNVHEDCKIMLEKARTA